MAHIVSLVRKHGVDCWWTMDVAELLPPALAGNAARYAPLKYRRPDLSGDITVPLTHGSSSPAFCRYRKGLDTLDVWFDSGSSWLSAWAGRTDSAHPQSGAGAHAWSAFQPADLVLEGSDQHRSVCACFNYCNHDCACGSWEL